MSTPVCQKVRCLFELLHRIPENLIAITARVAIFSVFWRSAQSKIDGWQFLGQSWKFFNINESTFSLFEYEYQVPLLPSNIAATMATYTEFFLALAILFGLATRLSALGLLLMTAVIQFAVYPDSWPVHILWAAALLYLMKHGAGCISLDKLLCKKFSSCE